MLIINSHSSLDVVASLSVCLWRTSGYAGPISIVTSRDSALSFSGTQAFSDVSVYTADGDWCERLNSFLGTLADQTTVILTSDDILVFDGGIKDKIQYGLDAVTKEKNLFYSLCRTDNKVPLCRVNALYSISHPLSLHNINLRPSVVRVSTLKVILPMNGSAANFEIYASREAQAMNIRSTIPSNSVDATIIEAVSQGCIKPDIPPYIQKLLSTSVKRMTLTQQTSYYTQKAKRKLLTLLPDLFIITLVENKLVWRIHSWP